MESRHDTVVTLTLRQVCARAENCVPARLCVVTSDRPYLPVGGTSATFIAGQTLSTDCMHVLPGKYFVCIELDSGKSCSHINRLTSYSPEMSITFNTSLDDDDDFKKARDEVGFLLPCDFENSPINTCALCSAPLAHKKSVEIQGRPLHPWCKRCFTCGCEIGDDAVSKLIRGGPESRLYCRRCADRSDLRAQKGETIRSDVQRRKAALDGEPPVQGDLPKFDPPPVIDPVTKERTLDVLALSKDRIKKSFCLRAKMSDADVRSVFHVADRNKNGAIDSAEMTVLLQSSGMCLSSIPAIQKYQVKTVMEEADRGEEVVSLKKFCKWYQHADWKAIEENMQYLERVAVLFLTFDTNGNTTLERNELVALHSKLVNDGITTLSFESLFAELDKNNSQRIELNEFVSWFQSLLRQSSSLKSFSFRIPKKST